MMSLGLKFGTGSLLILAHVICLLARNRRNAPSWRLFL
jgi:hypothetical protein